jgi:hypothetical protein
LGGGGVCGVRCQSIHGDFAISVCIIYALDVFFFLVVCLSVFFQEVVVALNLVCVAVFL